MDTVLDTTSDATPDATSDEVLDESLVARMREYLAAGTAMDLPALEALYDEEFENLRIDEAGQVVRLTKAHFMARFRALAAQGESIGQDTGDVRFLATTRHGDQGTVVMYRCEQGVPARYTFVWRWADGHWATVLREFSFERDVSYLKRMMAAAAARG
ncbi:nuclear transport factor 2 family protein [Kitasatospora sp. NPDC057198]|uniref:nuclear transport factor 2 family protein n=1 Tax=Kitasatospora sp. NPDC057198 TaxID=3346046 RepID=UPI00362FC23F